MTPEGKVKKDIKQFLENSGFVNAKDVTIALHKKKWFVGWYYMPVQGRMSIRGIPDFMGMYLGWGFGIEAKAADGKATSAQSDQLTAIAMVGGGTFLAHSLDELRQPFLDWMRRIKNG